MGKFGAKNIGKVINGGNFGTNLGNLGTNIRGLGTKLADRIGTDVNAQSIGNVNIGNRNNVDKTETEILRHRFRLPATTGGMLPVLLFSYFYKCHHTNVTSLK